jgi:hypothetical protein
MKIKTRTKTRPNHKPGGGMPDTITVERLRSPAEVQAVNRQYRGQILEHDFFALARRAIRKGRNPPAVFRWTLANDKAHQVTTEEDDEARKMLRAARGPTCVFVRNLVNKYLIGKRLPRPQTYTPWEIQQALAWLEESEGRAGI